MIRVIGIMYQNDNVGPADIIIYDSSSWLFNGTGLQNGSHITGLLGREVDHLYNDATTPPGIALLAHSPYTLSGGATVYYGDMTVYTAPSGATVYAAGTFYLSWGVDSYGGHSTVSPAVQQMMRNLLANFVAVKPPVVSLSPASLAFGSQVVGTTSAAQSVTLSNTGSSSLNISSIATTGDYTETNNCNASLGKGASCNINVSFTPTATGTRSGTLSVTDNASGSPQTVALSGSGIAPAAALSPASLNFASQLVGTTSSAQTLPLSSTGSAPLNISHIATSGDYTQNTNCGGSLGAGASCNINVSFKPIATGTRTGTLSVTDNASGSPQKAALTGTGVIAAVNLAPTSLNFGKIPVGTTSTPMTVTLSNTGTGTLLISSMALTGPNPADYAQTNNCSSSVDPGANCTITITFTPGTTGNRNATLAITDNAPKSP